MAALLCGALATAAHAADQAASGVQIAPAEDMLFMQPHMNGVDPQTELDYAVDYSGSPDKVNDTVLVLSKSNSKNDARVTDRTGQMEIPGGLPCNPVIIYFLEHDITEMQQLTGGQRRYFQQRVRLALAANPAITPVDSESLGLPKHVKARQVVIQPYLNDPNAERFTQYTGKCYTFVIADDVPARSCADDSIRSAVQGQRLRASFAEGNHRVSGGAQDTAGRRAGQTGECAAREQLIRCMRAFQHRRDNSHMQRS
ncbi:hypothetical protein BVER_01647 [Candidatus Burkholderia verschuerenii]|uniref:Uncharacterized protein n=1 Tax=Candidatus Burkholderia verschuerenii TaxID=242163 RepID=A0A0L0MJC6_9BURK|nr:hypothetical protein BVER_01647 [Candidatus Burkholderia verschuerenii]